VRLSAFWLLLALAPGGVACRGPARVFAEHRQGLDSVQATAAMTVESWMAGNVSQTSARLTLERTQRLLADQQTELSSDPELLATADGSALSQREERLSRLVASLFAAVVDGDHGAARRSLESFGADGKAP
jgi:hypothetical protein